MRGRGMGQGGARQQHFMGLSWSLNRLGVGSLWDMFTICDMSFTSMTFPLWDLTGCGPCLVSFKDQTLLFWKADGMGDQ